MLVKLSDLSPIRKQVEVEIPADAVTREFNEVAREFAKQVKVPGFRPGKVPTSVARNRFQKEIEHEVLDRLMPLFFREAVVEKELRPVGSPEVKRVDQPADGQPIRFVAEFDVLPRIVLTETKGIPVNEPPTEVEEKDVEQVIERFREQGSTFRPIEGRAAQDGDWLVVDIKSRVDGEERSTEGYYLQLGGEAPLPELNEALVGKNVGDQASFEKKWDEDAPNEEVRGKTVHYELTVKELKSREVPEINDEFAKSVGLGESADEMRKKIREDLERHREHEALQSKRQQVADALTDQHQFEVPESLVAEELDRSMRHYARYLVSQGVDLEKAEIDWRKVEGELRPEAEKRVKRELILDEIARRDSISVSDVEVDAEIRKAAAGAQREFAEVKQQLRSDGGYEALRVSLTREKALEAVVGQAKVTKAKS